MHYQFRVVFHDTDYPTSDEQDSINELVLAHWEAIGYGRKYDGVRFEAGSLLRSSNQKPVVKEVLTEAFEEWMNERYRASGRTGAEFCTILARPV